MLGAAAIADLKFGSNGEGQVMDFVEGLIVITIIGWCPCVGNGVDHALVIGSFKPDTELSPTTPAIRKIKSQLAKTPRVVHTQLRARLPSVIGGRR